MAIVIQNGAESNALQLYTNKIATGQDLSLRLFQNNITPAEGDVVGGYTIATFTGYASLTLTGSSWTISGTAPTQIAYAQRTFTSSADQTLQNIYGYYYVRASAGDIMGAERFTSAPFPIENNGDEIRITPQITAA